MKQKIWLNDHLKRWQLIFLTLDEGTVLTEKCGVLFGFFSDLLPKKPDLDRTIIFPRHEN